LPWVFGNHSGAPWEREHSVVLWRQEHLLQEEALPRSARAVLLLCLEDVLEEEEKKEEALLKKAQTQEGAPW
jgi:hypothetical protein